MKKANALRVIKLFGAVVALLLNTPIAAHSVDEELLKILLSNGAITPAQHQGLVEKLSAEGDHPAVAQTQPIPPPPAPPAAIGKTGDTVAVPMAQETIIDKKIAHQVADS